MKNDKLEELLINEVYPLDPAVDTQFFFSPKFTDIIDSFRSDIEREMVERCIEVWDKSSDGDFVKNINQLLPTKEQA